MDLGRLKGFAEPDMAFDFLCFFSNEANTQLDLQIGRFGVNPYRTTHFDPTFWQEKLGWEANTAKTYVDTLSGMDQSNNRVFDLRVPGVNQFMSTLANGVAEAMAGQRSPQEALDGVAAHGRRSSTGSAGPRARGVRQRRGPGGSRPLTAPTP